MVGQVRRGYFWLGQVRQDRPRYSRLCHVSSCWFRLFLVRTC